MSRPKLELVNLTKEYEDGAVVAVDDIDLSIEAGETVALLGSSGCGKSTTLNMIVGLEEPTSGDIQIDGKSVIGIPPGKRNVGLVFQDYAVFSSMTVRQNLAFGLEVRKEFKGTITKAVGEVAELLGMEDKLDARAKDLGGSELQRVAIGRTLVTKPEILLLDEPLSNLEAAARLAMRKELRRLQSEIGLTIIYVTHDQIEALSLADRIAVMNGGKIVQVEETTTICERPGHIFVADFLGSPPMNLLKGHMSVDCNGGTIFSNYAFDLKISDVPYPDLPDIMYTLGIRPESIKITSPQQSTLQGKIILAEPRGPEIVLTVVVNKVQLKIVAPSTKRYTEGSVINLSMDPETFVFFNNNTNHRVDFNFAGEYSR
jgi:multiple sugar transport system ATP-binding protein